MNGHAAKAATTATHDSGLRRSKQPTEPGGHESLCHGDIRALQASAGNRAVSQLLSGGTPLAHSLRADLEARFGADFGDVRIHDDSAAHASAAALGARAYTYGSHLVFGAGYLAPQTGAGRRLLSHELAHVIQQRRGGPPPALDPCAPHEHAAEAAARAAAKDTAVPVTVAGATGVGIAADWRDWVKSKAAEYVPDNVKEVAAEAGALKDEAKAWVDEKVDEYAPEEVQAVAAKAADVAGAVSDFGGVVLNPASLIEKPVAKLRDAALNDLVEYATGVDDPDAPGLREIARDQALEAIGTAKGVAVQGTELVDTLVWAGGEVRDLKQNLIRSIAKAVGIDEDKAAAAAEALPGLGTVLPVVGTAESLAQFGDLMKEVGLVDERSQPSLTAPVSQGFNAMADAAEEVIGAAPSENDDFFTPMEIGELKGAIGTQVGLSFVGAEEVKVALNVVGALSGLRAIVESARSDPNWQTSPRFWGGIIGMVLSIVGLKHMRAASKITTLILKYGWIAAAVPPMAAMIADYTDTSLSEDERERRMKQHWMQVVHVIKDAILHIAQSQGGKPPTPGRGAPPPQPVATSRAAPKPPPPDPAAPVPRPAAKAPLQGPPVAAPRTTPKAPLLEQNQTAVKPPAATPKPPAGQSPESAPLPIARRTPPAKSAASQRLEKNLKRLPPERQGTVTPLRRPRPETPPAEPARQAFIELDTGPQPTRRGDQGLREINLPSDLNAKPLELDYGPQPVRSAGEYNEIDLGPAPAKAQLPKIYKGSKPPSEVPGMRARRPTFGEPSSERSGTGKRTGINYRSFTPAEIAQQLRVDYDPVAGRPRAVSYRVDADTDTRAVQTSRQFTRDITTEGAQPINDAFTNSGYDRGHLAQREAFKGDSDVELAADYTTNVVPMQPNLNRGPGSPWRAAETRTIAYAKEFGHVNVEVQPNYGANPPRLRDGTPIPESFTRTITAPDGTVLESHVMLNQ